MASGKDIGLVETDNQLVFDPVKKFVTVQVKHRNSVNSYLVPG